MTTIDRVTTTLEAEQLRLAKERETTFDVIKARRFAYGIVRRELKGKDIIAGTKKPRAVDIVGERLASGEDMETIAEDLRLTARELAAIDRYLLASVAERETRTFEHHASIIDDVVSEAYLLWFNANYGEWQARCDVAAENMTTAKPLTTWRSIRFAHANYWRTMRGGKVTGNKRDRKEGDAEKRLYTIASALAGKANKGTAKPVIGDLPKSLGDKARQIAKLLSTGSSAADVADMLAISRPTVSAHCKRIGEAITANNVAASREPSQVVDVVMPLTARERNRGYVAERFADMSGPLYPVAEQRLTGRENRTASEYRERMLRANSRLVVVELPRLVVSIEQPAVVTANREPLALRRLDIFGQWEVITLADDTKRAALLDIAFASREKQHAAELVRRNVERAAS